MMTMLSRYPLTALETRPLKLKLKLNRPWPRFRLPLTRRLHLLSLSNNNNPLSPRIRPPHSRPSPHRHLSTSLESITTPSLDPITTTPSTPLLLTILLGLPLALWTYKCLMMYIFQRKIIYMGYAPIGARRERLAGRSDGERLAGRFDGEGTGGGGGEMGGMGGTGEVVQVPKGVEVEEVRIPSGKGGMLSGIVVRKEGEMDDNSMDAGRTVIVYFQGNAGSPLHRLPLFHSLLTSFPSSSRSSSTTSSSQPHAPAPPPPIILAVAPRSYWTSVAPPFSPYFPFFKSGPSQDGLIEDYTAVLRYASERWADKGEGVRIVVWGHSLGASVAVCTLSSISACTDVSMRGPADSSSSQRSSGLSSAPNPTSSLDVDPHPRAYTRFTALILENPFLSIPHMLRALYPQKWLPYHYMGGLVWDTWDVEGVVRRLVTRQQERMEGASGADDLGVEKAVEVEVRKECEEMVKENVKVAERSLLEALLPDMMVLLSEKDELVPNEQGRQIWEDTAPFRSLSLSRSRTCSSSGSQHDRSGSDRVTGTKGGVDARVGVDDADMDGDGGLARLVVIEKALHEDAWKYRRWGVEMRRYIRDVEQKGRLVRGSRKQ
ncbi:uncharacterized protein STEHIDRAFT_171736 [Stereum hirsutum FP-91666 SS1]|uniref:uncharacterized protein n=1 Tax=Stereum hirsutum (strain FP-91666) TaxID=721885 RepID=UPI00044496B9|nr:uncharacterized protein STEHIDRAFT_171736 [Stereum hirsutum FP-91666 SS1]EIM81341.1 hypothetical protein STEHIDRAFT_171736 [Stereum hirsutum FP-91666 SS1]